MSEQPPPLAEQARPWPKLLHRWFVQYNPFFLLSAALVLAGLTLVSRGMAEENSLRGAFGVASLAELYAWALIGGAALLTRNGQRRPAVLLGLLALVYQSDLTLLTETGGMRGGSGWLASALWVVIFAAKLAALGRALRVRLERRAFLAATLGAAGIAGLPVVVYRLDAVTSGTTVGLFLFALLASLPRTLGASSSALDPLDDWGQTVLRRTNRAAWAIWGVAFALHVLCWSVQVPLALDRVVLGVLAYVAMRHASELQVWGLAVAGLLLSRIVHASPTEISVWIALSLTFRAFARLPITIATQPQAASGESSPYRAEEEPPPPAEVLQQDEQQVSTEERTRLLLGALFAAYLGAWLPTWNSGALPEHILSLDLSLVLLSTLTAWKHRQHLGLAFSALSLGHALVTWESLPRPRNLVEWGTTLFVLGFVLLGGSLAVNTWIARKFQGGRLA